VADFDKPAPACNTFLPRPRSNTCCHRGQTFSVQVRQDRVSWVQEPRDKGKPGESRRRKAPRL